MKILPFSTPVCRQTATLGLMLCGFLLSCTSSTTQNKIGTEKDSAVAPMPVATPKETSVLETSFRGKTTFDIEALGVYSCGGGLLSTRKDADQYAVSYYAQNVESCQKGQCKYVLEKKLGNTPDGKANFTVLDELNVQVDYPRKCYAQQEMAFEGGRANCLIEYADNNQPVLTQVFRLWKIDPVQGRFILSEVPGNTAISNPYYNDAD